MASFALECPKCGSLNTASTFIFAKNVIKCNTCGEEINVKQSRMASKKCGNCGKVVVCDQAKMKNKVCPSCGHALGVASATAEYKMAEVLCPKCFCEIEINKTLENDTCPICECVIPVKATLAKQNLVNTSGISVIKYEGDNSTLVWKHPIEDFNWGSQLLVHESQEAVFFYNGQALDTFSKAGRYTLETENLPALKVAYSLPTGNQNAFHAEVYFINKTLIEGIRWGTNNRIRFKEPLHNIPFDIGANGTMNVRVSDGKKLLIKLIGTTGSLRNSDILENTPQSSIRNVFDPIVKTTVASYLPQDIRELKVNLLEFSQYLQELSNRMQLRLSERFEEFGLSVPIFNIANIDLPEDSENYKQFYAAQSGLSVGKMLSDSNTMLAIHESDNKKTTEIHTAQNTAAIKQAQRDIIIATGENRILGAQYEQQIKNIEAMAQAERHKTKWSAINEVQRQKGLIDAEVMAEQGYSQKDVLQAGVQKAYAEGMGKLSSSGGAGGIAGDVVGMATGFAMAGALTEQFRNAMPAVMPAVAVTPQPVPYAASTPATEKPAALKSWTCACGAVNQGKFCVECGAGKPADMSWTCTCGAVNHGKFCMECGKQKPVVDSWTCTCGTVNQGKFCMECGKQKPAVDSWICKCGNHIVKGKFCPECGAKREDT